MTPTARSMDLLRRFGYLAEPVERWLPGCNLRRDDLDLPGFPVSSQWSRISSMVNPVEGPERATEIVLEDLG